VTAAGGAGGAGASRRREEGSQTLELAMAVPLVVLWLCVLLHAGLLAADLVLAQTVVREAARVAAVADDAEVRRALDAAVGDRPVRLTVTPASPGRDVDDLVTARVEVRSRAFEAFGVTVWLSARATMRVEDR